MSDLRKAAELALRVLYLGDNEVVPDNYDKQVKETIRRLETALSKTSKFEWFSAPIKTEWGERMVCAMVNIDDHHYFDVFCEEWQKENVELMLGVTKREWVEITKGECDELFRAASDHIEYAWAIEAKLKEKNSV